MTLYFFTVHDETGKRIDDDSDFPLTEEQLDAALANLDKIDLFDLGGQQLYRQSDGKILGFQGCAQ